MKNLIIIYNSKIKKINKLYLLIIFNYFLILIFLFIIIYLKNNNFNNNEFNNLTLTNQIKIDYDNNTFAIIKINCSTCGLFSFYNYYLGCIDTFIKKGYTPIIDLRFPNIFNRDKINPLNENPWELFFNQPYQYKIENVQRKAKNIKYFDCLKYNFEKPNKNTIYKNKILTDYWHNIAIKYIPINNEIIKEANLIRRNLFRESKNILGVLARGTDYITVKPKGHPIQPNIFAMIKDIKEMDEKNKYDWIFFTTEDDIIKNQFIFEFKNKLKYINQKKIEYNYKEKNFLIYNKHIIFDYNYFKTYLINIIILSKCVDIICGRNNGSIAAFILSNGFRNNIVYYLGEYQ